jgi:ABC-type transport system involved in cytochrome c biogenesis permease subunit
MAMTGYAVYLTGILAPVRPGSGYRILTLWPRLDIGASLPTAGAVLIWAAGLCVVAAIAWYGPRLVLAALGTLPAAAATLTRDELRQRLQRVYDWRGVALVGAVVALAASLAAYFAPFPKDIRPLMAVLRSNVWLAIHVLTITAAYGAAALAWGLGNIALGYFLLGRYRDPARPPAAGDRTDETEDAEDQEPPALLQPRSGPPARRLPPLACETLARLNYKVVQLTVLLLAIGTILGGMWADVSWGRFWGWDPKEVWALISLLAYMLILHGRHLGWMGPLGLAVGSVFGFTMIVFAWYGVNFLMPGKHSYGEGGGQEWAVVGALVLNWVFLLQAVLRAWMETRRERVGPHG